MTAAFLEYQRIQDTIRTIELEIETAQPLIAEQRRNIEALNNDSKKFESDHSKAVFQRDELKRVESEQSDNSITVRSIC